MRYCSWLELYSITIPPTEGADFIGTTESLTFNESSAVLCTEIQIVTDTFPEELETFLVTLTSTDSAVDIVTNSATVSIEDDDGIYIRWHTRMYTHNNNNNNNNNSTNPFIGLVLNLYSYFSFSNRRWFITKVC